MLQLFYYFLMDRLMTSPTELDREYQYTVELQTGSSVVVNESEEDGIVIDWIDEEETESKTGVKLEREAFQEPFYRQETTKIQRIEYFLPKIMKKYEAEQKVEMERRKSDKSASPEPNSHQMNSEIHNETSNSREEGAMSPHLPCTKKIKKEQYPTKNMLPSFKSSFLTYLAAFFPAAEFDDMPLIRRIRVKNGINLKDYEDMFNEPVFKAHLWRYFRNKVIFRDLLQSRIEYKTKRIYFKKINIFEEAFLSGEFKGIN